jgi:hypothetical protein
MHIAQGLGNYSEDYSCKIARTVEEAMRLVEQGFEYVTEMDSLKLFRKRK